MPKVNGSLFPRRWNEYFTRKKIQKESQCLKSEMPYQRSKPNIATGKYNNVTNARVVF